MSAVLLLVLCRWKCNELVITSNIQNKRIHLRSVWTVVPTVDPTVCKHFSDVTNKKLFTDLGRDRCDLKIKAQSQKVRPTQSTIRLHMAY